MTNRELSALLRVLRRAGVTRYEDGSGLVVVLGPDSGGEGKAAASTATPAKPPLTPTVEPDTDLFWSSNE